MLVLELFVSHNNNNLFQSNGGSENLMLVWEESLCVENQECLSASEMSWIEKTGGRTES